jgi:hypothetical protein
MQVSIIALTGFIFIMVFANSLGMLVVRIIHTQEVVSNGSRQARFSAGSLGVYSRL